MSFAAVQLNRVHLHPVIRILVKWTRSILQHSSSPGALVLRHPAGAVPVPRGGEVPQHQVAED